MRILIVTIFFPPLNSIASLRPYSWAKYWTEAKHDVTVLTTSKYQNPELDLNFANNGFNVIELPLPGFLSKLKHSHSQQATASSPPSLLHKIFHRLKHKNGIFNSCRMPDFSHFWINSAVQAIQKKGNWDLVISTAGPYTVHIVAEKLKKLGLASKWIADYRDTWSNNFAFPGLFPFNLIEKAWERKLLRSADAITTVSQPLVDSFRQQFRHKNVHLVENGFDTSDLNLLQPESIFPDDGKYRIVHTGSIYQGKRDPSALFQAIAEIGRDSSICHLLDKLEVLFAGTNQANLQELIDNFGVSRWVKMAGFLSRNDALRMQRDAHLLLFLPWTDASVDGILTGKLFEYFFSKTPIMAVGAKKIEAAQKLILEGKFGHCFITTEEIKTFLCTELKSPVKKKLTSNSKFLELYDRKALAMKLLENLV